MAAKDNPTRGQLLEAAVKAALGEVHTTLPGKVTDYDAETQTASVELGVKFGRRLNGRIEYDTPPILTDVPVGFPAAGDVWAFTMPIPVGTAVTVLFYERSVEEWLLTGVAPAEPASDRRFSLSDALAIPLGRPLASPLPSEAYHASAAVLFGDDIRLGSSGASKSLAFVEGVAALASQLSTATAAANALAAAAGGTHAAIWSAFSSALGSFSITGTTKVKAE